MSLEIEDNLQVRRATLEDLPGLLPLWQSERLPVALLEKRFTEFQVVRAGDELIGAVGLHISAQQGKLHSEAFARPELAEAARPLLWERLQTIAQSHGLTRLWTRLDAPFWRSAGLEAVDVPRALPTEFAEDNARWAVLALREESALPLTLDKQFEMFRAMSREETERTFERAKKIKFVAFLLLVVLAGLVAIWVIFLFRLKPHIFRPH